MFYRFFKLCKSPNLKVLKKLKLGNSSSFEFLIEFKITKWS